MKRTTLFSLLLLCLTAGWHITGNAQYFSMESLRGVHPENQEHFSFPLITDRTDAARKINTWLHGTILETLPGKFSNSPFEKIWPEKGSAQGVTMLNYLVYANNSRYVSLDITGTYAGAYLSPFSIVQNFDAQNGQPVTLEDLFTEKGLEELQKLVIKQRTSLLRNFLSTMDTTSREAAAQYQSYKNCLASISDNSMKYDKLLLTGNSLKIIRQGCSSHTDRNYDSLGDFENEFDFTRLKPLLSNYGTYLLTTTSGPCPNRKARDMRIGLYRGNINKQHPISFFVEKIYNDGSIRAFCFYDDPAKKIDLQSVKRPDGSFEFREIGKDQRTTTGVFRLRSVSSFHLEGKWSAPDSAATYKVDLR